MKKVLSLLLTLVLLSGVVAFASAEEALEPVTLTIMFHGSNVTDDSAVMEKVNAYLAEKINAKLDVIWGTWGDFDANATMSLNAGDPIDMYFTCSWSQNEYNTYAKKGMYVRLDDPENNLIEKYASDLWATLPAVLTEGATIEGSDGLGVYAVPGYKDIATQNCWDINVDLLEKYGYTLDDIKNTDYYGFGDILKTVKEGEGDNFYPLMVEGMVLERMVTNSIIVAGDSGSTNLLSYYINPTDTAELGAYGNVMLNKFATDEYKKFVEKTREYYLAGYIDPALSVAETANDTRVNKQLTGQYLIGTQSYALGYELQASQERNIHVEMVPVTPPYVDTTSSQGAMVAISTASENPDRAMMFLNLLNTDPYLMTLLNYGVEGVHYTLADGLVTFTDKRSDFQPWTNGMGNVTLLPPTAGQGAGFWDSFKAYYGEAHKIPIIGFTLDSSSVQVEMSALANVAAEYALALDTGAVDPAEKLPEFLQKLDAAGMQKYLDEANTQLAAFLAAK
ncbi:MAG: ABC transporter substrate-binding protein [Candidatus Limiplasma sp.]|nr:ABC transporter substrate-binding protein [Candidatus Limiplasma sp.]